MIHPGEKMSGGAEARITEEGERFICDAGNGSGEERVASQCTCPYCNRSFGLSDGGKPIIEPPDTRIACYCTKCDYRWNSQVEEPKRCPSCGSYRWKSSNLILDCKRCGHMWESRKSTRPLRCPKCRSVYWDKPRVVPDTGSEKAAKDNIMRYEDRLQIALSRCTAGEGLYDVCKELDVSILEVALALRKSGLDFVV